MQGQPIDQPFEFETGRTIESYQQMFKTWDSERVWRDYGGLPPDNSGIRELPPELLAPEPMKILIDNGLVEGNISTGMVKR